MYLSLFFCQKMHLGYVLHTCIHPMTSLPSSRAHPSYIVSNFEANPTDGSQDTASFGILPPLPGSSQSDHYQHLTTQHLRHGLRTNTTTTHHPVCPGHSRCTIASALTARTASISLPVYDWDSQDAYHSFSIFCCTLENWLLLNHIPPDSKDHLRYVFAVLGNQIPRNACTMDANWQQRGTESDQGKSFCFPRLESNRE